VSIRDPHQKEIPGRGGGNVNFGLRLSDHIGQQKDNHSSDATCNEGKAIVTSRRRPQATSVNTPFAFCHEATKDAKKSCSAEQVLAPSGRLFSGVFARLGVCMTGSGHTSRPAQKHQKASFLQQCYTSAFRMSRLPLIKESRGLP
jgi:hypothetical protein